MGFVYFFIANVWRYKPESVSLIYSSAIYIFFYLNYRNNCRITKRNLQMTTNLRKEKNQLDATYLFNTHSLFNMFRPLIRPSSGACD